MFIRSERLFLRPGWPEDWSELLVQIDDWAMVRHLVFMAETAQAAHDAQDRNFPQFLVTLPDADGANSDGSRLIGCAGLVGGEHGAELVCWIAPAYWGQGYATEALRAVLSLARTLGHRQITAIASAHDAAAGRVLAKLGFGATGFPCLRLCPARGVLTQSLAYRCDLGEPSDCDAIGDKPEDRHAA